MGYARLSFARAALFLMAHPHIAPNVSHLAVRLLSTEHRVRACEQRRVVASDHIARLAGAHLVPFAQVDIAAGQRYTLAIVPFIAPA